MPLNFQSTPIANGTECPLNFVGCNVTLNPQESAVLNCSCTMLVDLAFPFSVYPVTVDRTISPGCFAAVTACTPDFVTISWWCKPPNTSGGDIQLAFGGKLELVPPA